MFTNENQNKNYYIFKNFINKDITYKLKNYFTNKELSKSKTIEYKDPFSKKDKDYFDKLMELLFSEK